MALLKKGTLSNIPQDAVILSEMEALKHQMEIVENWEKPSEVYTLKYGPYFAGLAALLNGAYLNNYYRRKFMLGTYGQFSSYVPICILPGVVSLLLHSEIILRRLMLMNYNDCPLCLQMKAGAIQTTVGVLFPSIVAPLGCAALAVRYATYDLPYIHEQPKTVLGIFQKMFKKIKTKSIYMCVGQSLLAAAITFFENSQLLSLHEKLAVGTPETLSD